MNNNLLLQLHKNLKNEHDTFYTNKGNLVVADIEFTLKTRTNKQNRNGKDITVSFPIKIEKETLYNISKINKDDFKHFYRNHKDIGKNDNGSINALKHYHSEAFLFYYFNSNAGMEYIFKSLKNIKNVLPENTEEITSAQIHLHTTLSMCGSCQKLSQGQDKSDKEGFMEHFQNEISTILIDKGFDISDNFTITLHPSYSNKHDDPQKVTHIQPNNLNNLNPKRSPIDCLNTDGQFNFKKPTHTLFTSGGSTANNNNSYDCTVKYTQKRQVSQRSKIGTIQTYESTQSVISLKQLANDSATKIQSVYKGSQQRKKFAEQKNIIKAFNELPRSF